MLQLPSKETLSHQLKVNVKDFGAMGNASNDDSQAIQDAIEFAMHKGSEAIIENDASDALNINSIDYPGSRSLFATQGGAVVYFPAGTYMISRPIIHPATGGNASLGTKGFCVHLEGENATSTIICGDPYTFCQSQPDIDPYEVRGLVEWNPQYRFQSLTALGMGELDQTPLVDSVAWENSRKIRELADLDAYAEELLAQIFDVDLVLGMQRLTECMDLYEIAVTEMERQVHIPRDESTPERLPKRNNGRIIVEKASYMYNRALQQSITNLTFYSSERATVLGTDSPIRSCAIYRRWPWMIDRPRLFDLLEKVLRKGLQGGFLWFPVGQEYHDLLTKWNNLTDIYLALQQMCSEGSRLQLRLENVEFMGGNNIHHPAFCRFEGSVINSQFKNIRAKLSDGYGRIPPGQPHARSPFHYITRFREWLTPGIFNDYETPSHDCILFEFDQGKKNHYGADKVGLQYSQLENIWAYGKQLGVFKGRANGLNWRFVFSDGALFGPSYHFTNSANSLISNIYHEGGTDRHVFLLEHCMGMRFTNFGTGGQRLDLGSSHWPQYARDRARTLNSTIKLSETIGCIFDGRQGITPMHTSCFYGTLLEARALNQAATDDLLKYIIASKEPAFIELDEKSYRNQFLNIEMTFASTNRIHSLNYRSTDKNGTEKTQSVLNWIIEWLKDDPRTELNKYFATEIKLGNQHHDGLNQVSGWLYIHEYMQTEMDKVSPKPEYYRFLGTNQSPSYHDKSFEWGGLPFKIGTAPDSSSNLSHNNWGIS